MAIRPKLLELFTTAKSNFPALSWSNKLPLYASTIRNVTSGYSALYRARTSGSTLFATEGIKPIVKFPAIVPLASRR